MSKVEIAGLDPNAPVLECRNLSLSYFTRAGEIPAVVDFNMTVMPGEAVGLVGESGCGKSTLLNIISGLLQPSQGRILFNDVDVTHAPTAERNIAQVFQFPVVYDTMTVRDNLAFPLRNWGANASYVAERVQQIAQMSGCGGKAANCFKQRHLRSKCGIGTAKVYYLRYSTGSIKACVWGLWCARVAR